MKIRLMHPAVGEIAFPLKPGGSLVVGRLGSRTDVEISWDPRISRRHCRLWEKNGRVWFQDLASRNGSWIGEDRVSGVVRLAPGSSVLIGETVLLLPEERDYTQALTEVEETHERPLTEEESFHLVRNGSAPSEVAVSPNVAERSSPRRTPPPRQATLPARFDRAPSPTSPVPVPVGAGGDYAQATAAVARVHRDARFDPPPPMDDPWSAPDSVTRPPGEIAYGPTGDLPSAPAAHAPHNGLAAYADHFQDGAGAPIPIEAPQESVPIWAGPTVDLRAPTEASSPVPESEDAPAVVRGSPRFISAHRVSVRAQDRADLRELWARDISKGGVFVETRSPPPPGTHLEVQLETPAGSMILRGTVVHVLTEAMAVGFGGRPGVGIQFTDLDTGTREAIQAYVEGLAEHLKGGGSGPDRMSATESDEVLQRARRFLQEAEQSDFYSALEVFATAPRERIDEAALSLHRKFSEAAQRIAPPQAARLEAALNVLGRVRRVLTHEEGRLEYDFRNGHVRASERIQAAQNGTGPSLSSLRQAWNRVFPERVDRAAMLTRKAFAARQRQDLATAIDSGRAALDLNPFFEELKQTVAVWESAAERKN